MADESETTNEALKEEIGEMNVGMGEMGNELKYSNTAIEGKMEDICSELKNSINELKKMISQMMEMLK